MSAINQNRYDQLVRRLMDLQGPGSKVNDVLTELFPMIDVESDRGELQILSGTNICFGGGGRTGVAAQSPTMALFNPADSGVLGIITRVIVSSDVNTILRWGLNLAALPTLLATQVFRDTRQGLPSLPVCQVQSRSAAALASGTNQARILASSPVFLEDPNAVVVLAPGTGFEIGLVAVASTIQISFQWRERVAEPSELNL